MFALSTKKLLYKFFIFSNKIPLKMVCGKTDCGIVGAEGVKVSLFVG